VDAKGLTAGGGQLGIAMASVPVPPFAKETTGSNHELLVGVAVERWIVMVSKH
jgi:hypothetical protein